MEIGSFKQSAPSETVGNCCFSFSNGYFCRNFKKTMRTDRTFTMLKPDAVEKGHIGAILEKINASGFRIVALKLTHMTTQDAKEFYAVHKERPFYGELVEYMTRGPIVAAILEKENAVEDFRTLIGATNPADAAEGTIRKLYAASIGENAVHGSDSDENAAIEGAFHFAGREMF
jgi:nucleoside-diphosphate kinase